MDAGDTLFDRYQIVRRIARGGMGTVWEAEDLRLVQRVALKHVSFDDDLPTDQLDETRQRILREARMAAQLRGHPHVISIYDVIESDGDIWLVLEYLPSHSLAETLNNSHPTLDPGLTARIGAAVADALAAAHARGIIHRDVKPGNILIGTDQRTIKLTDFGISHAIDELPITRANIVSGTPAYMAREVARGEESTPASDIFSLGATLYRATEGQPPFGEDPNTNRLLLRVATGPTNPPTKPTPLTPLILRLLEFDPHTRPDAATARDQLQTFATLVSDPTQQLPVPNHTNLNTPQPETRVISPPPKKGRRKLWATLAAVAVLAVLGAAAAPLLRPFSNDTPHGAPPLPSTVSSITLTGDPKAADACALIDLTWLRQFGEPIIIQDGRYVPAGCQARMPTPNGDLRLNVYFSTPVESVFTLGGQSQRLGDLTIVRNSLQTGPLATICQNVIVLADRTRIYVESYGPKGSNLCTLSEVGTAAAVNTLAQHGITYRPNRTASWQITNNDACALLDSTTLASVPTLVHAARYPGYANWWCNWGIARAGSTEVSLNFQLADAALPNYGEPVDLTDRRAWKQIARGKNNPHRCIISIVTRPAPTATSSTELLNALVDGPQPDDQLCAEATQLATAAVAKLK